MNVGVSCNSTALAVPVVNPYKIVLFTGVPNVFINFTLLAMVSKLKTVASNVASAYKPVAD